MGKDVSVAGRGADTFDLSAKIGDINLRFGK
jgi:hypothetical protein